MDFLEAVKELDFLQYAIVASIFLSPLCGLLGTFIVAKRATYFTGAIAHAVLGGIGLSRFLGYHFNLRWLDPVKGAILFSVFFSLMLGAFAIKGREREDTLTTAVWSIGMAFGVVFIFKTPSSSGDLLGYLFGNILLLSKRDIYLIAAFDAMLLFLVLLFYGQFMAVCFDEEFARARGIRLGFYYPLLLCLFAIGTVLVSLIAGLLMTVALLSIPAATANLLVQTLPRMMCLSSVFTFLFILCGLFVSFESDLPSGPTIVILGVMFYLCGIFLSRLFAYLKRV